VAEHTLKTAEGAGEASTAPSRSAAE